MCSGNNIQVGLNISSQTTREAIFNDHGRHASIVKGKPHRLRTFYFSLNRLMNPMVDVLLKCVIRFSISFRWYAFPNFCTQISRPLAYGVRTSSKASATAALLVPSLIAKGEKIIMCSLFKLDCFLVDCFWSFTRISYRSVLKWYSFGGFCLKRI